MQVRSEDHSGEFLKVKLRYRDPEGQTIKLIEIPFTDMVSNVNETSNDFRFAAGVAAFGTILRNSQYKGDASFDIVMELARGSQRNDETGYRAEFIDHGRKAQRLRR